MNIPGGINNGIMRAKFNLSPIAASFENEKKEYMYVCICMHSFTNVHTPQITRLISSV